MIFVMKQNVQVAVGDFVVAHSQVLPGYTPHVSFLIFYLLQSLDKFVDIKTYSLGSFELYVILVANITNTSLYLSRFLNYDHQLIIFLISI